MTGQARAYRLLRLIAQRSGLGWDGVWYSSVLQLRASAIGTRVSFDFMGELFGSFGGASVGATWARPPNEEVMQRGNRLN